MKLVGFFNRDGGTFRTTDMQAYEKRAEEVFREAGHDFEAIVFSGNEIVPAMERAARRDDIDGIVAGGGDGTISAAASIAWKNGVALGVVPAGTMNLFARSLKVPLDIWQALDVLAFGEVDNIDIASANGRPFIHQFSAGLHARMVRYRNSYSYRSRLGKMGASTRAAFGVVFNPPEFEVEFEAAGMKETRRVSAISVSNNPFGENALLYADNLRSGELGFYTAKPLKPLGVARLAIDMLRELPTGIVLGAILGLVGLLRVIFWQTAGLYDYGPHWQLVGLTVFAALVGIVTFGSISGSMLPFILQKLRLDPATASAPFVATLVDVTGLVIYFSVALLILSGTLL